MTSGEVLSMAAADSFHNTDGVEGEPNDVKTIIEKIVRDSLSKNVVVNNEDADNLKIDTEVQKSPTGSIPQQKSPTRSIQQQKNAAPIKVIARSPRTQKKVRDKTSTDVLNIANAAARQARPNQRSQSLPTAGSPELPSGNNKEPSLYKTELCKPFLDSGFCRYAAKCQFAHGYHELKAVLRHRKYKTEPCKNFQRNGKCPYGSRCRFVHAESDDQLTKINCLNASGPCAVHAPDDRGVAVVEPDQRPAGHVRRWTDEPVGFRAGESGEGIMFGREVQFKDYTKSPGDRSHSMQFREYPPAAFQEHCEDPTHNDGLPYCAECRQTARRSHEFEQVPLPPPAAPGRYMRRSYDSGLSPYAPPREYVMEPTNDYRVRSKSFSTNNRPRQFSAPLQHRRGHSSGDFHLEPALEPGRPRGRQSMPPTLKDLSGDDYAHYHDGPACTCADCVSIERRMYKPRQKGHPKIDPRAYAPDAPGMQRREGQPRRSGAKKTRNPSKNTRRPITNAQSPGKGDRSPGKEARNKAKSPEMNLNNTPGAAEPLIALPDQKKSPGSRTPRSPHTPKSDKPRRASVEPVGGDDAGQPDSANQESS